MSIAPVAPVKIRPGLKWKGADDRVWECFEMLPFGQMRVRTVDLCRSGEMSVKSLRVSLAEGRDVIVLD